MVGMLPTSVAVTVVPVVTYDPLFYFREEALSEPKSRCGRRSAIIRGRDPLRPQKCKSIELWVADFLNLNAETILKPLGY
jgi:hypothetical protein